MQNLKTTFAAVVMMFVLVFGTTFANAGIIIAARGGSDCTTTTAKSGRLNTGIIIAYTGIIIAYTGIIIALRDTKESSEPCRTKEVDSKTASSTGIIIA